jgi:general secretion pathway protein D
MRAGVLVLFAALLVMFAGCATKNEAYTEAKQLLAEGKIDTGLASLEEAARKEPDNLEIRAMLARQREAIAARHLLDGESARSAGNLAAAEQGYRRALEINPNNERAQAGLAAIERDSRHAGLLKRAEELMARKDYAAAEPELRTVLQENPDQKDARRLLQQITEIEFQSEKVSPALKTAYKKPVTLEFRDAGLKSIFEIMSRTAGINVVFDKDVRQDTKTSIFVRDTNVEDVFKLLLMTNQLTHKVLNENSVLIYPNTPAKQKEYQELAVRSFYVVNTDVKQIVAMVRGLVKTKDMHVDERLNLFVMKDTPDAIRLVERLVAVNDLADPEVMLEVEVLEIRRDLLRNLGALYPDQVSVNMLTAASAAAGGVIPPDFRISSAGVNGGESTIDNLTAIIKNPALIINLKQTEAIINVLANPRIRVKNREKAKILIGDKVPVVTTTATANVGVASSVSYLDVGLKLDVESTISLQDEVSMKVSLEVSNIVKEIKIANGGLAYQVGMRTAATTLALKDGETQVLAGLISDDERANLTKVPGLAELPWLGKLFTNKDFTRNKTEIALLITPRIVRNISRPTRADSDLYFGTENAIGVRPVTIRKNASNSLAMSSSGTGGGAGFVPQDSVPMDEPRPPREPVAEASGVPVVTLVGPEQVLADKEFAVSVSLGGSDSLPPAELELSYDPGTLELLDGGEKSGSRTLKMGKGGGGAELRFKAVAQKPGTAQVSIKGITLQGDGGGLPEIPLPPAISIDIR